MAPIRYDAFSNVARVKERAFLVDAFQNILPEKRATNTLISSANFVAKSDEARNSLIEIIDHMIFLMMAAHDTTPAH